MCNSAQSDSGGREREKAKKSGGRAMLAWRWDVGSAVGRWPSRPLQNSHAASLCVDPTGLARLSHWRAETSCLVGISPR